MLLIAGLVCGSGASAHPLRPTITAFGARDEGARIVLRVRFCGASTDSTSDPYIALFRMWDENGAVPVQLLERRVSGRIFARCGSASLSFADTFPPGLYAANVAIVNRANHGFTRIAVRPFVIG